MGVCRDHRFRDFAKLADIKSVARVCPTEDLCLQQLSLPQKRRKARVHFWGKVPVNPVSRGVAGCPCLLWCH